MFAIGIMSGTSLDGVDTVLVEISNHSLETNCKVIEYNEYPIPKDIYDEIKIACDEEKSSVDLICSLNFKLGNLFADAVEALLIKSNFDVKKLDYIAMHGQTIYHLPVSRNNLIASTLQIGEPAILAYRFNTQVISNFRTMDMAAGGQGAPLVPYSEYILFGNKGKNIALQNIGGIGNVTVIPNTANIDDVYAFDTGPGNMMINEACHILFHKDYDDNGSIASKGKINRKLLDELLTHDFITKAPPKSTGREDFGEEYVKKILNNYKNLNNEDIVATFTMFTAKSIKANYDLYIFNKYEIDQVIIGGGGSHNKTLMRYLKCLFAPVEVVTQDELGYSGDAKEAIAFAILGNETLHNSFSNVPSATGAKRKVILGNITPKIGD